ncbi:SRPBCC family protein [Streptomyces sp. NPDC056663]|uniref:SRPBCC family protein n=1 Tax=Streptomyces sp. NPDC056663 TaxID=3345899 RepID=UPI0036A701CF
MKLEVEVDKEAPVIVSASCEIAAPVERVWDIHADVTSWAQWQKDISSAEIDGAFAPGSVIHWGAHGYDARFPALIGRIEHQRLTVWSGTNDGIHGIHGFVFTPQGDTTVVTTAESWSVDPGPHAVATLQEFLESWLHHMKVAVEGTH